MSKQYPQVPMDAELRAKALRVIEAYKTRPVPSVGDPLAQELADAVPQAVQVIGEHIAAYDHGELTVTAQKQLIATMKKMVKKYHE